MRKTADFTCEYKHPSSLHIHHTQIAKLLARTPTHSPKHTHTHAHTHTLTHSNVHTHTHTYTHMHTPVTDSFEGGAYGGAAIGLRRIACVLAWQEKKSMESAEVRVILGRAVSQCVHRVCQRRKSCWGTPAGSISPAAVGADMSTRTVERWSAKRWHIPAGSSRFYAPCMYAPCTAQRLGTCRALQTSPGAASRTLSLSLAQSKF